MRRDLPSDPQERMEHVMGVVWRREGEFEVPDNRTSIMELIERERLASGELESNEEYMIRGEAFDRLLEFLFCEGPHPGVVMRRLYALVWAKKKTLIWNMTQTDLSLMFSETKAAVSWRIKKLYTGYLAAAGYRGTRVPGQKSASACLKYAKAAEGNENRKKGTKKKASNKIKKEKKK